MERIGTNTAADAVRMKSVTVRMTRLRATGSACGVPIEKNRRHTVPRAVRMTAIAAPYGARGAQMTAITA